MQKENAHNTYNNGKVHVCEKKCSTCIFRPGNLMNLNPGRAKEMLDETILNGEG